MSLDAFNYAVPSIKETAKNLAEQTGSKEEFIREKIGLSQRYILSAEESGVSLSAEACKKLLTEQEINLSEIDLLICVTQNPDRKLPHNSAGIAAAIGLSTNVAAFDISLGCSGYVYAIQVVLGFLNACGMRKALLVTCDPYSRIMAAEDHSTNCVFGDAATATLISANGSRSDVLAFDCGTDGARGDAIRIEAGGAAMPLVRLGDAGAGTASYTRDQARLKMQGRAVFNFVMGTVPNSMRNCLEKAELELGDIDYFALHQGSIYMLDALAANFKIPQNKLLKNMSEFGNTVSSTIPLLLADLDRREKLSGATVLLSGFGVGLSWATSIIRFN